MRLFRWFRSLWQGISDAEATIDHAPVENKRKRHIHTRKLKEAADRHAKPFKVASVGLPREVMTKPGQFKVVGQEPANVTPISRRAKH